jgi:hypothetical protein
VVPLEKQILRHGGSAHNIAVEVELTLKMLAEEWSRLF